MGLEERVLDDFQPIWIRLGGVVAFLGFGVGEVDMCALKSLGVPSYFSVVW